VVLFYAIVCHSPFPWCVPLLFPNLVIVLVSGLGLCACFVDFISFKVVVAMCFLCDIECVSGPFFTFFFSYMPDRSMTYLNSGVISLMKVLKLWSTMVEFLNNMA